MVQLFETLISLGICVVLPIAVVWLVMRYKMNADNCRRDIILAVQEKNGDVDVQQLMKSMNKPSKLLKEKLLGKLQLGLVTSSLGTVLIIVAICMGILQGEMNKSVSFFLVVGGLSLAVGGATLTSYQVGRKMLAREMDAEADNMQRA